MCVEKKTYDNLARMTRGRRRENEMKRERVTSERACANESGQIEKLFDRGGNRERESRTRF